MPQQARNFVLLTEQEPHTPTHLIYDLDRNLATQFGGILSAEGIEPVTVGPAAPNLIAHAERWVLSIKSKCLDHFVVFGEDHLRYLIDEYVTYYLESRPHQGLGKIPLQAAADNARSDGSIPLSRASQGPVQALRAARRLIDFRAHRHSR